MNWTAAAKPALMSSRMPHVFVIPPEEEQQENPPWCCFDADQPNVSADCSPPSHHDIHLFNVPYTPQPSSQTSAGSPAICAPVAGPPRTKLVSPRKLEKKQRPEAVKIVEKAAERGGCRDVREDSDVIEVVKVKRGKDDLTDPEEHSKMKRTKTLKARATRAFQSIKNVGRGSRKQRIKDLWTSSEGVPGAFKGMQEHIRHQEEQLQQPPLIPPSLPNSRSLSQIFQSTKPPQPPPAIVPGPASQHLPSFHSSSKDSSSLLSKNLAPEPTPIEPATPKSSTKNNKRFSVRELHKVFTFPSSSPGPRLPTPQTAPTLPPARNDSVPSMATSTVSSDYDDPVDDAYNTVHFFNHRTNQKLGTMHHRPAVMDDEDDYGTLLPGRPRDLSFEMRLDSLHFDSLSFDPEEFNISIDGNGRR